MDAEQTKETIAVEVEHTSSTGQPLGSGKSLGVWVESRKLVYISRFKSKYLQRMGQSDGIHLWLFPEETSFLVSQAALALQDGESGRILSADETFSCSIRGNYEASACMVMVYIKSF